MDFRLRTLDPRNVVDLEQMVGLWKRKEKGHFKELSILSINLKDNGIKRLCKVYKGQDKNEYQLNEAKLFLDGNKPKVELGIADLSHKFNLTFNPNLKKGPQAISGKVQKDNGIVSYHL